VKNTSESGSGFCPPFFLVNFHFEFDFVNVQMELGCGKFGFAFFLIKRKKL